MDKKVNQKKLVDRNLFEFPQSKMKVLNFALKYKTSVTKIFPEPSEIIICNKSSNFDKLLVSNAVVGKHVFLKDEVIQQIYSGKLSAKNLTEISKKIKLLLENQISVVIFPEKHLSVFGESSIVTEPVTNFIKNLNHKISFLTLIGSFFIQPVWSKFQNKCLTKIDIRNSISPELTARLDSAEFNEKFNNYLPSSASNYTFRYPLFLQGKAFAQNLEQVIYTCPFCKQFFTIYSEFSCVKCKNCGSAFEFSYQGEIGLTKEFINLDGAKIFQKNLLLNQIDNLSNCIISYDNISLFDGFPLKKNFLSVSMKIFKNHLQIKSDGLDEKIQFKNISDIELKHDNVLVISLSNEKKYIFQGKNRENFYIIFDLIELNS